MTKSPSHLSHPVLQADQLSVRYGDKTAISNVSFDIQPGEMFGLLGPNGAGKTTLIKSICGQITPCEGQLTICQKPVTRGADNRKSIGLVPQDIGLYSHMSARENLDVFGCIYGLPKQQRKAAIIDALETVGLSVRADEPISQLSGGMKRRINFAAAIIHKPALLILDEPTAGVDVPARDAIHDVTKRLTQQGMAVLFVTHEMKAAEQICDRIIILVDGVPYDLDTPHALLRKTFGPGEHCYITVTNTSENTINTLKNIGFIQSENAHIWQCNMRANGLEGLVNKLGRAGISPRELTVRRPTLTDLMHHIESQARSAA